MARSVYLETSVISYLVARPNQRDLIVAAHQQITCDWWATRRHEFTLFASVVVIEEALRGDPEYAKARMSLIEQLRLADVTRDARALAAQLLLEAALPSKANADALHISIAAVNGLDNLLTWNCTHLANAATLPRVNEICRVAGFEPPYVSTPEELMVG
ncbi:MAG: type II toxin-antitoxin system VapC family toxin [Thermoanaerobaculia bacterium]